METSQCREKCAAADQTVACSIMHRTLTKIATAPLLYLLLTAGCASSVTRPPAPPLPPHTEPIAHLGINWAYGPFPAEPLQQLASYEREITIRAAVRSLAEAQTILQNLAPFPDLSVLFLIETANLSLVRDLSVLVHEPNVQAFECGNELDLAGVSPQAFADFVRGCSEILLQAGFKGDVISGGIYTVDTDTLAYAAPMLAQNNCGDVTFGVHLYGDSSDAVLARLRQVAGCHDIAVTEFGSPSRTPQEDAGQLAYLQEKLAAFQRLGVTYATIYQLASGPSPSNLDNFGIYRLDFTEKPGAAVLRYGP